MTGNRFGLMLVLCVIVFTSMTGQVFGADIKITSDVEPDVATADEFFEVTVTIAGGDANKAGAPEIATPPEFINLGQTYSGTSTTIVNMSMSVTKIYKFTFKPTKIGNFKLGEVSVTVGGQTFTAQAKPVEVVAGSAQVQRRQPPPPPRSRSSDDSDENGGIFIKSIVDNKEPYIGQQITYTFELYNRLTLINDTQYNPASTTGFWSVELPKIQTTTQIVNGVIYRYTAIKSALFPTTSGDLTIGEASLSYTEGGFFTPNRSYTLQTKPIAIKVKPLPENGKPDKFSGAVGTYSISGSCDKTALKVGDVVTMKITVAGKGNLDLITSLETPDFSAFRTYDPRVGETLANSGFEVGGSKSWDYILSPRHPGEIVIGKFSLSYFDTADEKYHTVSTEPVKLTVTPGSGSQFALGGDEKSRMSVENIATDIRFIKPDKTELSDSRNRLHSSVFFFFGYILSAGAFTGAVVVKRRRDTIGRNTGLKRRLKAWKAAEHLIKRAESHINADNPGTFTGFLNDAVVGFIGDMLNVGSEALTTSTIEQTLISRNVSEELALRVRKMLELSDFVRFSSDYSGQNIQKNLLAETSAILSELRKVL